MSRFTGRGYILAGNSRISLRFYFRYSSKICFLLAKLDYRIWNRALIFGMLQQMPFLHHFMCLCYNLFFLLSNTMDSKATFGRNQVFHKIPINFAISVNRKRNLVILYTFPARFICPFIMSINCF